MTSANIHSQKILILDFGSQYTQLIARRVRELGVYCEIWDYAAAADAFEDFSPQGIISPVVQNLPILPNRHCRLPICMLPVCRFSVSAMACKPWPSTLAAK